MVISSDGNLVPGQDSDQDLGTDATRWQNMYSDITHALSSVRIAKGSGNTEADIQLRGGGTGGGGGDFWRALGRRPFWRVAGEVRKVLA